MTRPLRIVCAHQGYELYGSDRVFVEAVKAFRTAFPTAEITVLLPCPGPVIQMLEPFNCLFRFNKLWVIRRRSLVKLLAFAPLMFTARLIAAFGAIRQADILYISTVVVVNLMIAARFHPNAIVHVHEIPDPKIIPFFRWLLRFAAAKTVFNSDSSRRAYALPRSVSIVVYNGYRPSALPSFSDYDGLRVFKLLMIGRVSLPKGQDLLIEAVASLPQTVRAKLQVRVVGSAFEDDPIEDVLVARVTELGLSECISFQPFDPDPVCIYQWCDCVVVPSRVVESFGLVAIEAMSYGKAVIAADQGGLQEIVEDGVTGWLFRSGSAAGLSASITHVVNEPALVKARGHAGYERFLDNFHEDRTKRAFMELISEAALHLK